MKHAKGVSAKTNDFKENGEEVNMDYLRLMQIVKDAGYTGYVGIEYEGENYSEREGIILTKELLEKVGSELS
jgi:hydroxypyruvate isomerase